MQTQEISVWQHPERQGGQSVGKGGGVSVLPKRQASKSVKTDVIGVGVLDRVWTTSVRERSGGTVEQAARSPARRRECLSE